MRTLILLSFLASLLNASSLTVCGISDGGAGDTDGIANGSISVQCSSSAGLFSGTVTERLDIFRYEVGVQGIFQGSGGFDITGFYDITPGYGSVFRQIFAGTLSSHAPGGVVEPGAYFRLGDLEVGAASPTGTLLPVLAQSDWLVNGIRILKGPHAYSITLSWSAGGPDHYFDFSDSRHGGRQVEYSVDIFPEPSMAPLMGAALLALLIRAKWHT